MAMFDDLNARLQDPTTMALLGAAQGFGQASMPSRYKLSPAAILGMGIGGFTQGAGEAQKYQTSDIGNQMGMLNLQRAKAMQPFFMNQIGGMQGNAPLGVPSSNTMNSGGGSPNNINSSGADALFGQALMSAYMSGDMKKASDVLQSWAEHNPSLAGQIKNAQEQNTYQKTPEGTYVMPTQGGSSNGSAAGGTMTQEQQNSAINDIYNPKEPLDNEFKPIVAADGKDLLPNQTNLFKPDPTGTPKYKPATTETDVNMTKLFQAADDKSNSALTGSLNSLQTEQFRINELAKIYQQVQAGTLTAQHPDYFNKMAALGFKDDPKSIEALGGIQAAMQNHILQLINQYKDTNSTMGEAPSRMFGGVINTLLEEGENPGKQPGGLYTVLTQAKGLVDHNIDLVKGWNEIGGLGNRQANGYTLRPEDYVRNFMLHHKIDDYKISAQKSMGQFKGMSEPAGTAKTVVKQMYSPSTKKVKLIYSDGTEVLQ